MSDKPEKKYGVWHGALSGRFYASWAKRVGDPERDLWEQTGTRHDVTEGVEAYIAQATADLTERVRLLERIVVVFNPPFSSFRLQNLPKEQALLQEVLNAATEPIE